MGHSTVGEECWKDDQGFYTPMDIGMLYGGSDGVDCTSYADQVQALGYDGVRVFGGRLTPSDTRTGQRPEDMPARIDRIAGMLDERRLELHVPILTDTGVSYDFHRHVNDLGRVLVARANIRIGEIENEIQHESQHRFTLSQLKEFADQLHGLGFNKALTGGAALAHDELLPIKNPDTGEVYWSGEILDGCTQRDGLIYPPAEIGNLADTHYDRGRWPFYKNVAHGANELRTLGGEYDLSRLSGEPGRVDHSDVQGQHVAYAYTLGVSATGFMNRTVLHGSQMRDANGPLTGVELDAAKAAIRGHRILPRGRYDFQNANNTGAWPNSPIKSAAFMEGPATNGDKTVWRFWSFRHVESGKWFGVIIGESVDRHGAEFQHGFHIGQLLDKVDNLVHVCELLQ